MGLKYLGRFQSTLGDRIINPPTLSKPLLKYLHPSPLHLRKIKKEGKERLGDISMKTRTKVAHMNVSQGCNKTAFKVRKKGSQIL